jgi:APA family basic amino acid/polyamine antiporter
VIGSGIFLTPAVMARQLGAPGLTYAMWLVAGSMALCGALCYGELSARVPRAGGAYVYLREGWGEIPAFLYGWKCLLVMDPGLTAALAAGLAEYVAFLTPLGPAGKKGVSVAVIAAIALLAIAGTRIAAGALVAITALKLGILGLVVGWSFLSGRVDAARILPTFARDAASPPLVAARAGGFVAAFFSYGGWWEAARMAGEVRDPERTLPRVFMAGIAIVTATYILSSMAFIGVMPPGPAESSEAFAARLGEALFGPAGGTLLAIGVVVSVVGSLTAIMIASPRVYVALARDGLFPQSLARLHPRLGTPVAAIAVQAALASLLVVVGTFSDIVAYFIFVTVAFIAASVAGLYRLPPPATGYRTPGRTATPAVFIVLCVVLLVMLAAGRPVQALAGLAVVAAGIPVYFVYRRLRPASA